LIKTPLQVSAKGFIYAQYSDNLIIATLACQQLEIMCALMDFQTTFQILRYISTTRWHSSSLF